MEFMRRRYPNRETHCDGRRPGRIATLVRSDTSSNKDRYMTAKVLVAIALTFSLGCVARSASDIGRYVGWTIAAKKTITGYIDENGKRESQFNGCNYNWKIIFDDSTYLTCEGYSYHYAYRPDAVLLVRNNSWTMLVENEAFDMKN
jgi:hypothetical protein